MLMFERYHLQIFLESSAQLLISEINKFANFMLSRLFVGTEDWNLFLHNYDLRSVLRPKSKQCENALAESHRGQLFQG